MRSLIFLIPAVYSLNILLTSIDSWVSSKPRYLYKKLKEQGHNVVYVGPLLTEAELPPLQPSSGSEHILQITGQAGGDYNHLLPANQKYYHTVRKIKQLKRGAKNTIRRKDSQEFDAAFEEQHLVQNEVYGQDRLEPSFWYVSGSSLEALTIAFSEILPKYLPDFEPQLVIIGPNSGLHLSTPRAVHSEIISDDLQHMSNKAEALTELAHIYGKSSIAVSMEDHDNVYYQDESIFNPEERTHEKSYKTNSISKNLFFVNEKMSHLIDSIGSSLDQLWSLNVNFPSMNHPYSQCTTNGASGPDFEVVSTNSINTQTIGKIVTAPSFSVEKNSLEARESLHFKISQTLNKPTPLSSIEFMRLQHLIADPDVSFRKISDNEEINSVYTNKEESAALSSCQVSLAFNHLIFGNNIDSDLLRGNKL